MDQLELHEVAAIFPEMASKEFEDLKEDIRKNGLLQDIWVAEGKIIEGKHRYKACIELGIEPRIQKWDGKGSLIEFVISLNLKRRHLTPSQKATVALKLVPALKAEAKERQGTRTDIPDIREKIPGSSFGRASQKVCELIPGTNPRYIFDADKILEKDRNIFDLVCRGKLRIPDAKKVVELPEERRSEIYQGFENGQLSNAREIVEIQITKKRSLLPPSSPEKLHKLVKNAFSQLDDWYMKYCEHKDFFLQDDDGKKIAEAITELERIFGGGSDHSKG